MLDYYRYDLKSLAVFCVVTERGTFTEAGYDLCMSQPAISAHMKALGELERAKYAATVKGGMNAD